ncbi:MAG: pentapeptide repeat-containing protein [Elusimicrobia bacterium]|nr:pentapeptide repeat-containing protein [Elusimicrobiota bacterium]
MRSVGILLAATLLLACHHKPHFFYASGACIDRATGERGYNKITLDDLMRSADGECADFRGLIAQDGAKLHGTNLRGALLAGVTWKKADLSGADLTGADLKLADFESADFRGANMEWADLASTSLNHADLRASHLSHANLSAAFLHHADLSHAELRDAELGAVDLRDTNLDHVRLTGAKYDRDTRLPFGSRFAQGLGMRYRMGDSLRAKTPASNP